MANKKNKYFVCWKGRKIGVFSSWNECNQYVKGFSGAQYEGFKDLAEAEKAFEMGFEVFKGNDITLPCSQLILESISVDAAWNTVTKDLEFRGVETATGKVLFEEGVYPDGTNNVGEYLALVQGLQYLKDIGSTIPVYSDSVTAITWVRNKQVNSSLQRTSRNEKLFRLLDSASRCINENEFNNEILKWDTATFGQIKADYDRK